MTDPVSQMILDSIKPGAVFIGGVVACILYGITCLQVYIFFFNNRRDSWRFKLLIYGLWILDSLHMAMVIHALYFYFVENFGRATAMLKPTWSLLVHVYFTIISDFTIRTLFGKRVWTLSRNYVVVGGIAITTVACAVTGTIFTTKAFFVPGFAEFSTISMYLYASLATGTASDILVAASLCTGLLKTRTGFKKMDNLVNALVVFSINTSLLTTLCSIGCLVTYAIWPQKLIFLSIYFCLNKLFFNSLLGALNARETLRVQIAGLSTAPTSLTAATNSSSGGQNRYGSYNKESDFYELEHATNRLGPRSPVNPRPIISNPFQPPTTGQQQIVVSIDRHISVDDHEEDDGRPRQVAVAF